MERIKMSELPKTNNTKNDDYVLILQDGVTKTTSIESITKDIDKIQGPIGETGKSAYQVWLSLGNSGSEQDFINSLKGETGDTPNIEPIKQELQQQIDDFKKEVDDKVGEIKPQDNTQLVNIKNEVTEARTATTKEIFPSLNKRIDHELGRLNKKIEVTMLEQKDKESYVIENSVEGLTTDMVIKGKTLINFANSKIIREYKAIGATSNEEVITWDFDNSNIPFNNWNFIYGAIDLCEPNKTYTVVLNVLENTMEEISTGKKTGINFFNCHIINGVNSSPEDFVLSSSGIILKKITFKGGTEKKSRIGFYTSGRQAGSDSPKTIRGKFVLSKKIMVLEGDWTGKEIPDYFEGVQSFGEKEQNKISILSSGKNLFNTEFEAGSFRDGDLIDSAGFFRVKDFIKVKAGVEYIFSNNLNSLKIVKNYYDENKKWIKEDIKANNSFRTPENCRYVKLRTFLSDKDLNWINIKAQLEERSQSTSYEPYKYDKKDILLKEPLRSIKKIKDEIYEENEQLKVNRRLGQYVFTGKETWGENSLCQNQETLYFYTNCLDNLISNNMGNIICDNFLVVSNYHNSCTEDSIFNTNDKEQKIRIRISKSKLSTPDINGFKEWLKSNPTTIVYELSTPTIEVVENITSLKLKTYDTRTYISFENSIQGTSSFKAPVDSAKTISSLTIENNNLKEQSKKLKEEVEDKHLENLKQNLDMDFRLMQLEVNMISVTSNKSIIPYRINDPYQMILKIIQYGDFDKEDFTYKIKCYYENKRITEEEFNKLMSLIKPNN